MLEIFNRTPPIRSILYSCNWCTRDSPKFFKEFCITIQTTSDGIKYDSNFFICKIMRKEGIDYESRSEESKKLESNYLIKILLKSHASNKSSNIYVMK